MKVNTKHTEQEDVDYSMNLESNRLATFKDWPFTENCTCTPLKMAEAGFYHCPTDVEPDVVKCFVCEKELDGWEPYDDPWTEHKNHSKQCPFVLLNKTEAQMTLEEIINLESQRHIMRVNKKVQEKIKLLRHEADIIKEKLINLL